VEDLDVRWKYARDIKFDSRYDVRNAEACEIAWGASGVIIGEIEARSYGCRCTSVR
jgi:hypothetical protein